MRGDLERLLAMPDLAPLLGGARPSLAPEQAVSFSVDAQRRISLQPSALAEPLTSRITARHALELALQLELFPKEPVLAGLVAARTAALFASLEGTPVPPELVAWTEAGPPPLTILPQRWERLRSHQPGAPNRVLPETAESLARIWPLLGPSEHLMGLGGDERIRVDPSTRLNAYGCSPRPRPWAVTFASSTASSISERGYAAAEQARRRWLLRAASEGMASCHRTAANDVRRALGEHYGLPRETEIVLVPSGTDGELAALAVALLGGSPETPWTNLVLAPEETGAGVPLAATGRHFAASTARGVAVTQKEVIAGFPADIQLVTVAARSPDGAARPASEVDAECEAHLDAAVRAGRRVLLHVLDQSKTGLLLPGSIDRLRESGGAAVEVLLDASQARLSARAVRGYLERGYAVLVTGSKFFTGPPFAGALLLPDALAARLHGARRLPAGLADYWGRYDWPEGASAGDVLPPESNLGVALRWEAALAEMQAFARINDDEAGQILRRFIERVRAGIAAHPSLRLFEAPARRAGGLADWDQAPTILAFSVWRNDARGEPRPLSPDAARRVFRWLNADLAPTLIGARAEERGLAARRFHIGQPVTLSTEHGPAGALRICAGARLVSGEPSQSELPLEPRLERETADALQILEKIALILKHWPELEAADPPATF